METLITLIVFIFILGLLIFVHELGHFLAAKRAGIKVEEFAFGFPPRLFAIKKGETDYALNLFPVGGYVKMLGESEDSPEKEKHNPRSFAHQSAWVRTKVIVAGVLMNVILAWLLITIGFWIGMAPVVTDPAQIPYAKTTKTTVISAIAANSAAQQMGLLPGDIVTSFNGQAIVSKDELAALTREHRGQPVSLVLQRDGQEMNVQGTLSQEDPALGVGLADDYKVQLPVWWSPIYSVWETIKAAGLIFSGLIGFFQQFAIQHKVPEEAAGPVGIYQLTRSVIDLGFTATLNFIAVLSVNLAVLNILPIPALDGGRLLFIILEKFNKGKKVVNARIENIAHLVGFVLLMLLIATITYNDILRLGQ